MKQVKYTNWWAFKKKEQTIANTLSQLDLYNKTEYSKNKIIDDGLLKEAAKFAHENKLVYYVTIFEDDKPFCFLEINKGFYRVCFLDAHLRKYMSYDFTDNFKAINPDKLFLSSITFWEFEGSSDKMIKIIEHIFNADGTFLMIERDLVTNVQVNSDAKDKINVSSNWEEYPAFGNYDSLIKIERAS